MSVHLFDTQSRQVQPLPSQDPEHAPFTFYSCGPTVYGPAHIGNFRTFVLQDVLVRTLRLSGVVVLHIRNITDVDDKTIRDSQAEGKSLHKFTQSWRQQFQDDCQALNLLTPDISPSAVEHIPQQIDMISRLIEREHAYAADDGSVYFNIQSHPNYGKLSRLDQRQLQLGHTQDQRANNADEYDKEGAADFVLWKARRAADGDNYWDSPWGQGRPGWHLECSAMIAEHNPKATLDLHGGGEDLIFPHHDNEIAQSECSHDHPLAQHWFHVTHLLVDGAKMSKSLGNLYTLEQLHQLNHSPAAVRYLLLAGHYRKQLNFTLNSLDDANSALKRIQKIDQQLQEQSQDQPLTPLKQLLPDPRNPQPVDLQQRFGSFLSAFQKLQNDLNTPAALGELFVQLRQLKNQDHGPEQAHTIRTQLHNLLHSLGLQLPEPEQDSSPSDIPADIQQLADQRAQAKAAKDWAQADQLRDQIQAAGYQIIDSPEGPQIQAIGSKE